MNRIKRTLWIALMGCAAFAFSYAQAQQTTAQNTLLILPRLDSYLTVGGGPAYTHGHLAEHQPGMFSVTGTRIMPKKLLLQFNVSQLTDFNKTSKAPSYFMLAGGVGKGLGFGNVQLGAVGGLGYVSMTDVFTVTSQSPNPEVYIVDLLGLYANAHAVYTSRKGYAIGLQLTHNQNAYRSFGSAQVVVGMSLYQKPKPKPGEIID